MGRRQSPITREERCLCTRRSLLGLAGACAAFATTGCAASTPAPESTSEPAEELACKPLDDYSWDELAEVSHLIAEAADDDAAREVARSFGIVGEGGELLDQVRRFSLADGTVCEVRVAGLRHDQRADGSGCAGLTFLCAEVPAQSTFDDGGRADGGWEASSLRLWLDRDFKPQLPEELRRHLLLVLKDSNNQGEAEDAGAVTQTKDVLWVPSVTEVVGTVDWYATEYKDAAARFDDVLNAEGTQYQWFYEHLMAVRGSEEDPLARTYKGVPTGWWFRSVVPSYYLQGQSEGGVFYVMDSGYPRGVAKPQETQGVLFGFSL